MALALYRKYRPRTFAEVIGQEHVTEPLSQALRSGRLNHAYLFSGPRGCGKTSSARILARSLNCEQGPTPEPCGVCGSCRSLANDGAGSIDVIEIDAASHGGVDDARELREKAFFAPANSRYKIYVIDEAHMVSSAGFNALLKLVEEPPDYVKFIFATTEPDKVLGTIRSRTHHYPFRLIPPAVLRPYLQQLTDAEGVAVEPSVFPLVVRAGGGSARDSLSILDQLIAGSGPEGVTYSRAVGLLGVTDVTLIDEMCEALANGDGAAAYATIDRVAEAGHEPRRFASDLLERFRDLIVLQQVPDAVTKGLIDGPTDQLETMAGQAHRLGAATLSRCADILHNGLVEMRGTTAPRLLLELVTARMLLPGADVSASALLQRLERLERGVTLTPSGAGRAHPSDLSEEGPAAGGTTPIARGDEDGLPGGPGAAGNGPGRGGPGGGGKAAAMAAAAAARAASARPAAGGASVRPVSPAAPAATHLPPAVGAPSAVPAVHTSPASAAGPITPDGSTSEPSGAVPASMTPAGPDEPSRSAASVSGSVPGHDESAEVDGSRIADGGSVPVDPGYYDESPPWDEEPPEDEPLAPSRQRAEGRPAARSQAESRPGAPQDPRLERVRAAWQALGQHQPKVRAMQDYGIGVRDLDGDTIVFAAPTQALMERFLNWREAIATEFRKSPGGDWRIRCEVSPAVPADPREQSAAHRSTAGALGRPAQQSSTAGGPARNTGRTESHPPRPQRAPATDSDDDWPEPARPAVSGSVPAADHTEWPEPARPAGSSRARVGPDQARSGVAGPDDGRHDSPARNAVPAAGAADEHAADTAWPEPVRPGAGRRSGVERSAATGRHAGPSDAGAGEGSAWPEPARPGAGAVPASAVTASASGEAPGPASFPRSGPAAGSETPGSGAGAGRGAGALSGGSAFAGTAVPAGPSSAVTSGGGSPMGPGASASKGESTVAVPGEGARIDASSAEPATGVSSTVSTAHDSSTGSKGYDSSASSSGYDSSAGSSGYETFAGSRGYGPSAASAAGASSAASKAGARSGAVTASRAAPTGAGARGGGDAPAAPVRSAAAEAARAALANARSGVAVRPTASPAGGSRGSAPGGSPRSFSDAPPVEEAPYDPEYDGPAAAYEGFDPGDEPLDDVIDEKTARQSGEEQAIELLRAAFGAEKIGEL